MNFLFHNDWQYRLPKYWPFLLNHTALTNPLIMLSLFIIRIIRNAFVLVLEESRICSRISEVGKRDLYSTLSCLSVSLLLSPWKDSLVRKHRYFWQSCKLKTLHRHVSVRLSVWNKSTNSFLILFNLFFCFFLLYNKKIQVG